MHRWGASRFLVFVLALGCGADGTEADALGVGAACQVDDDCLQSRVDGGFSEQCLTQFKGGYCGIEDCRTETDCPEGSACVRHDDGRNYCFRTCLEKTECNRHRSPDAESNCSSNVNYTDADKAEVGKACVPPSG